MMKRMLIALLWVPAVAVANPSFLASEFGSHSIAVGKCYDLLDHRTPLSRAYTGVSALKDKTELSFTHSVFGIEDIATESIMFALKNPLFTGMRIAGYLSYTGFGAFEVRDERARITERISPYSLFAGAAAVFDVRSLTLEEYVIVTNQNKEVKGKNGLKEFLSSINAGININYYQTQLAPGVSAFSLFADINTSMKFPFPYIGMPEPLITEEYLENEKRGIIAESAKQHTERLRVLKETKGLNAEALESKRIEYQSNQDAYLTMIEKQYAEKKADVARVHSMRKKIYEIYYTPDAEIDEGDISNFQADAKKELFDLTTIASNAIADNYVSLRKNVVSDMKQNAEDIQSFSDKLAAAARPGALVDTVKRVQSLYETFISNEVVLVSQYVNDDMAERSASVVLADRNYTVKKDDTWESIAIASYSNAAFVSNIIAANKIDINRVKKPLPGTMIKLPGFAAPKAAVGGIEQYNTARLARAVALKRDVEKAGEALRTYRMTPVEELYHRNIMRALEKRIELFETRNRIIVDTRRKYSDLSKDLLEQYRSLDTTIAELVKDVTKAKLKKNLDYLQVKDQNDTKNVFNEYKKNERELFLGLLQEIYNTKNRIIAALKIEEADKAERQLQNITAIYQRKSEIRAVQDSVARMEASGNEAKLKKLSEDLLSDQKKNEIGMAEELAAVKKRYAHKIGEYDWQLYLTELTYLSSDEKKNTFAVGVSVKNLGMPVKFYTESEPLPIAFSLDFNYRFLNVENQHMTLYLHGGYSDVDNVTVGGGAMYRLFEMFEFRAGAWYDFFPANPALGEITLAGLAGFMFDVGLMRSRIDVSVRYERNIGLTYNAGVTIML